MDQTLNEREINIEIKDEIGCRKIVSVEIAPDRYRSERERVLKGLVKKVELPGFRKGKAPVDLVRRRFTETITSEALRSILPLVYGHVVESHRLEPLGDPVFSDVDGSEEGSLTFTINLEVKPSFEVEGYRNVKVKKEKIQVKKEEVEDVLKNLQERQVEHVLVDRPAVTDDLVMIDYAPLGEDGTPDEEKRVKDYPAQLGAGQLFPAFETAIAGRPAGHTGTVEIEYPQEYGHEALAGKKVEYQFTIKEVKEKRLPPLDDEFAKKVSEETGTLKDLKEDIEKRLKEEREKEARRKMEEQAIDMILERNPFEVPLSMKEHYKRQLGEEDGRRRQAMGAPPEEDEEKKRQMEELFEKIALRSIKRYFLMDYIARREELSATDEEIEAEIEKLGAESGRPIEEIEKYFKRGSEQLDSLRNRLRERKIFEIILGTAERG
jgi:trigger factor